MKKLKGRVAIVTASTAGIGFAIAKRLLQSGASVMISSRKQDNVDSAVSELLKTSSKVDGMVCHVGKREDRMQLIDATFKKFGKIDILVLNAAVNPYFGTLLSTPENAFDKIMEINIKSTFMLTKEVLPYLEKANKGSVVLVSSMAGLNTNNSIGAYSVSKTAMLGMTKAMTNELASKNIRINCIAPGLIRTQFSSALWRPIGLEEENIKAIPLRRIGTSDECANVVEFLVSDDASYITGEVIPVTGGLPSRL